MRHNPGIFSFVLISVLALLIAAIGASALNDKVEIVETDEAYSNVVLALEDSIINRATRSTIAAL